MADRPTPDSTPRPQHAPTRRRGAALEQAILRAAMQELTETGYAGLTMERVARRARSAPQTPEAPPG